MREIRQSGSEGGEAELNRPSLPLSTKTDRPCAARRRSAKLILVNYGGGLVRRDFGRLCAAAPLIWWTIANPDGK